MARRRFEFRSGSSHKFWEIDVKGAAHTVTYGRVGTDGQTKVKTLGSPAKARAAAEKLIESKVKKGYSEGKSSKNGKSKKAAPAKAKSAKAKAPAKASKPKAKKGSAKFVHVVEQPYPKGATVALWEDGRDLWFVGNEDRKKPEDGELRDCLQVQQWRFKSPKEAHTAANNIKSERPKKGTVPDWLEFDSKTFSTFFDDKNQPRIGGFAVSKSGPVTLKRTAEFDWVHPRPPSSCTYCNRTMMPTYELSGPLDGRLGKHVSVYVSFCPGSLADPYCEGTTEILVQKRSEKSTNVVHYGLTTGKRKSFYVVAKSLHWRPIGSSSSYVVTEHFGPVGAPGTLVSTRFKTEKAADAHIKEVSKHLKPAKPAAFSKWYRGLLSEIATFNRVPGATPLTLKLKPQFGPMMVSGSSYFTPRAIFEDTDCVGGQPNYTQSDWNRSFNCPSCSKAMLFVFQAGQGAPWWADQLNDGDAGSFQFFACARCQGPFGGALFECH